MSINSAYFLAGLVAMKEAINIRYMLSSLGVPVKGSTVLCKDNLRKSHTLYQPVLGSEKEACGNFISQVAGYCGGRGCQPH